MLRFYGDTTTPFLSPGYYVSAAALADSQLSASHLHAGLLHSNLLDGLKHVSHPVARNHANLMKVTAIGFPLIFIDSSARA